MSISLLSHVQLGVPVCNALLAFGQEKYDEVTTHPHSYIATPTPPPLTGATDHGATTLRVPQFWWQLGSETSVQCHHDPGSH